MEKQIERQEIYDGKIIHVVKDKVLIEKNGNISYREAVYHNGGVCIALKDSDNKFFVVRQYRYVPNDTLIELPAGKIEKDEDPFEAIKREAVEETGRSAKNVKALGYIIPTCGYSNEKIYLYYGEVDEYKGQNLDFDEALDVEKYSLEELEEMIKKEEIVDAKTICLLSRIRLEGLNG